MDCKGIQDYLPAYIDREFDEALQETIRLHLVGCDACRAQHAKLLWGWQALDAWQEIDPPDRLRRAILESVKPKKTSVSVRTVLAVAACLLIVFGITLYQIDQKGRSVQGFAVSQSPVQTASVGDISEDEIIANLLILQENDFFEAFEELVMIEELPFAEEPADSIKGPERSSLDITVT